MKIRKLLGGLTSLALSLSAVTGLGTAEQIKPISASAAQSDWNFDFGGSGAANGFTAVSATDGYNSGRGYGFAQTNNVANGVGKALRTKAFQTSANCSYPT